MSQKSVNSNGKGGPRMGIWLLVLFLGLSLTALALWARTSRLVARVNGVGISYANFLDRLIRRAGRAILEEMVNELLIRQAASSAGLRVTPEEIEARAQILWQQRFTASGDFEQWKRENPKQWVEWRERVRISLLYDKLVQQSVQVREEDVRTYYENHREEFKLPERVHARGILFANEENAREILRLLRRGQAKFTDMARAFSLDPATKDQEGDMGTFARGTYAEEIEKVVFNLEIGQISDPVYIPSVGYYLLTVEERFPPRQQTLEEVKEEIARRLRREREAAQRIKYLNELRQKAVIEILDERLRPPKPEKGGNMTD